MFFNGEFRIDRAIRRGAELLMDYVFDPHRPAMFVGRMFREHPTEDDHGEEQTINDSSTGVDTGHSG